MDAGQRAAAGLVAVAASFALAGVGPAEAATATAPAVSTVCDAVVDAPDRGLSGERAVDALADAGAVQEAAAGVDMTTRAYTAMLRADSRLRVDDCAGTFAVDPAQPEPAGPVAADAADDVFAEGGVTGIGTLDSTGDAFALSSRPGSTKTLYLDFRGMRMTGYSWNGWAGNPDFTLPAFSLDADAATFSAAEQNVVRGVWLRVAEDYAPFDLNVTTADPGLGAIDRTDVADNVYGTRVLVTNDSLMQAKCGCGGIAYVDVFDRTGSNHQYLQPALVFAKGLGSGTKAMAEAATHESGHNLGLSHDGRTTPDEGYYAGQGSWAPIMGVSYYKPVTQWSRGEYANANQKQDDLAIIASNGPAMVTDDHGNTAATATVLPAGGTAGGLISTRADVDYFAVALSAGGAATFRVAPQQPAADLDAKLSLYDAAGALVASDDPAVSGTADPTPGLASSVSRTLAAGTYYLAVDGVGYADPASSGYSDYASLGRYSVTVDAAATVPLTVPQVSAPTATVGRPYSLSLTATGGKAPYTWSTDTALPAGLSLSSAGVVSGTPAVAGSTTTTVRVTDATGASATAGVTVAVTAPVAPVVVSPVTAPTGTVGTAYALALNATGGTAPYTWALASGSLPVGLSLSAGGVVSGTPTLAATTTVVAQVTDATPGAAQVATRPVTITVVGPVRVTPVTLPAGTVGAAYPARTFAATGGTGSYTWSRASGTLPPGLILSGAGRLSGTPTRAGNYAFSVRATDSAGRSATRSTSVRIAARATGAAAKASAAQATTAKASTTRAAKRKALKRKKAAAARRAALRRERAARS